MGNKRSAGELPPRLGFTRYCYEQSCMVYGMHKSGVEEVWYIAQQSCNSIVTVWAMQLGWGDERTIDSCTHDLAWPLHNSY